MPVCQVAFVAISMLLATSAPAYAYIDPGMGSMILQGLLASFAAGYLFIKLGWARIKTFFSGLRQTKDTIKTPPAN